MHLKGLLCPLVSCLVLLELTREARRYSSAPWSGITLTICPGYLETATVPLQSEV